MENPKKRLASPQRIVDTVERLVDELQSSSLLDDERETNTFDEHRHHHHRESLNVEKLENLSSPKLQLNNSNEDILNEDCLLKIFSYLSLDDMIQVKRVCKTWYQVSQQWFKQVQTLVYNKRMDKNGRLEVYEKYYKRKIYDKPDDNKYFKELISILHSCGHHIKYYKVNSFITRGDFNRKRQKFLYKWVPKLCKNIVDVKIYGIHDFYTLSTFKVMTTHWKKLEKISIQYLPKSRDKNFFKLLRENKQLETIEVCFKSDFEILMNDEFLTYSPTTIKELIIRFMPFNGGELQLSNFISASKNFTSLQSLDMSGIHYLSDAVVAAIADFKLLTHLSLFAIDFYESRKIFDSIPNMKSLKSLDFSYDPDLYEDAFINMIENCIQLEQLVLCNGTACLTDKGMTAIAKLKRLKCLRIYATLLSTESIINSCGNLEVLECFDSKINDDDAIKLLKKATNLRFLRFVCCENLTTNILQAANKIANERKNNILCMTSLCTLSILSVSGYFDEDIDTPYFKYFKNDKNISQRYQKSL